MGKAKRKRESELNIRATKGRLEETSDSLHEVMHNNDEEGAESEYDGTNRDCASCGTHFTSAEAFRYHRDTKLLNKSAKFIPTHKIRKRRHLMLCSVLTCCYNTKTKSDYKVGFLLFYVFLIVQNVGTYEESTQQRFTTVGFSNNKLV